MLCGVGVSGDGTQEKNLDRMEVSGNIMTDRRVDDLTMLSDLPLGKGIGFQ
ncbi:MAG: hypothetical protein JSU69_05830 [Candidatus Zixiibacteriota bacterium]|nr:MAG: hypothetical protein JSU69_05830 [candidate division Zixibacteria bacterium]